MKKIIVLCLLLAWPMHAKAGEVSVAVAANFTAATREIVPLFTKASGDIVKVSYGSTGKLYAQIRNGAPFEVFLAADAKRPEKAEKQGLAVSGSRFTYALGKLYLWSASPGAWRSGEAWLKQGDFEHLAMANPVTAPYGLAAEQVMRHLGVWRNLQPKLVQGESIAQTFQFVATRNAEAGFVAGSEVKSWEGAPGTAWEIPQAYYAPIRQQAVLLQKGAANPSARAFIAFLRSKAAIAVIRSYGYGVGN